ncbi:MAG: methylenetetrahydrofolate--tRNA-(uracil(54)-C(5))-methyltransferase (FADH(2)-oxidizing) TrmFO [Myxococcota bacterium]
MSVTIIGAGLAGSELALQLAKRGVSVRIFEKKAYAPTPAQVSTDYAELVCSNSFRAASPDNAVGAIKEEMRILGSEIMEVADACAVPAGGALAVNRERFAAEVTRRLLSHPLIEIIEAEVDELPAAGETVIATGPLTGEGLSGAIARATGAEKMYFYDAIAPIVAADSIDQSLVFEASRWGKGSADYLNCPLDEPAYRAFLEAVAAAEKVTPRDFEEERFFEGCLPIEVMAARGPETLRFGCMKPVGLDDPRTGRWAHAVVQLRAENREKTAYNMVGFQTRMKWGAQKEVFRQIPGLAEAEFLRFGSIHRNTYIDSPSLLDEGLRLRSAPHLRFAGQITGVEGYVESTACGLNLALIMLGERAGLVPSLLPPETALGALHRHVLGSERTDERHVPSNVHWGMVPRLQVRAKKSERKRLMGERALAACRAWWSVRRPLLDAPPSLENDRGRATV